MNTSDKKIINKFLREIPLFKNFPDKHIKRIVEDMRIVKVNKDDEVVFKEDEGTDLYIVMSGTVRVSLLNIEGSEFILKNFRKGDFFGEMSLIDGKSRSANVIADAPTTLAVLKRGLFMQAMNENSAIALDLLQSLVYKLREATDVIESLAFLKVRDRVARIFADHVVSDGGSDDHGRVKVEKITHQDIASHIGSSREAVSKVLKVLIQKGLVVEKDKSYYVSRELLYPETY